MNENPRSILRNLIDDFQFLTKLDFKFCKIGDDFQSLGWLFTHLKKFKNRRHFQFLGWVNTLPGTFSP